MAKCRTYWSESTYRKRLKEGRGQGTGSSYLPWLTIHDFPSRGTVSRVPGRKTGRIHHLMSRLELEYFYCLDWDSEVTDVREQFPLDLNETVNIAAECRIRHPWDSRSRFPVVMTTDFVINKKDTVFARSVKPSAELSKPRVREKLEIERRYWNDRGVEWKLVTEKEISHDRAANICWLCSGPSLKELIPSEEVRDDCTDFFHTLYNTGEYPLYMIIETVESYGNLTAGSGICIFKELILKGMVCADLDKRIDPSAVQGPLPGKG